MSSMQVHCEVPSFLPADAAMKLSDRSNSLLPGLSGAPRGQQRHHRRLFEECGPCSAHWCKPHPKSSRPWNDMVAKVPHKSRVVYLVVGEWLRCYYFVLVKN